MPDPVPRPAPGSTSLGTTSDELIRPLRGVRGAPHAGAGIGGRVFVALGAVAASLGIGAIAYVWLFGDPGAAVPRVVVDIGTRPPVSLPPAGERSGARELSSRRSAEDVEGASGVSVIRGDGTAAPQSIIVRVPDEAEIALRPSPDPRLVETTRFGTLPRIGPDGARPLDVYSRPVAGTRDGGRAPARVAIVVGGLGISRSGTVDAIAKLPPAVTLAFAPYGQDLDRLAVQARGDGHEIMLQVPMEPFDYPDSDPGPHTLKAAARPAENVEHLHWAMGRLSGYVGIMNYMGGKLTSDGGALAPILREIGARGLGFLDDGSSSRSVVPSFKGETPVARAEVVLDTAGRADAIDRALEKLEAAARSGGGIAIGTASALPLTVERINRWAKTLEGRGVTLVPASASLRAAAASQSAMR